MITLKNITKCYNGNKVLDDINITFEYNNIYIIKGVSGCGKTTLLNILCGIIDEYEGKYLIDDVDTRKISSKKLHSMIGYMCQNSLLISSLTLIDNLMLINDNLNEIIRYTKLFGVFHLLNKYPNEISGGERQRFALIRTLLNNRKIILLDEPTSALDIKNSLIFIKYLSKIKDRIIILVTHKDIFDAYGEVVHLNYGKIEKRKKDKFESKSYIESSEEINNFNLKYLCKYARSKIKHNYFTKIIIVVFLILILLAISLKMYFPNEYVNYSKNRYPYMYISYNMIPGLEQYSEAEQLISSSEFIKYDSYVFNDELYDVYPIYDYDAVNFKIPGVLECGRTPENQLEVLVDCRYVEDVLHMTYKEAINREIIIKDVKYKIVGVVGKAEDNYDNNIYFQYDWNYLYQNINKPAVFMMYDELKIIGSIIDENMSMYKYIGDNNIYDKESIYYKYLIDNPFSNYLSLENKIANVTSIANTIADVIFIIAFIISLIGLLFIFNQIRLSLFYRKKEIGYLQIFGLRKSQIVFIIYYEYIHQIIICLLLSIFIFYLALLFLLFRYNFNLILPVSYLLLFSIVIIGYVFLILLFPTMMYMRKKISYLIS